ncbi:hypothetical protein Cylst_6558 (plasmid) [Cylindrospermum stagnale PCC 7417]|uniref:Uncharacterized protein n=1 Tax=Cylindrospermum stagnale PCC 7417 TaxID=56107 RepID=K9X8A2_9NOST|nr:hypothetical protein Cylst_6558 [Cylindrospermum stagnale PCC 7417]
MAEFFPSCGFNRCWHELHCNQAKWLGYPREKTVQNWSANARERLSESCFHPISFGSPKIDLLEFPKGRFLRSILDNHVNYQPDPNRIEWLGCRLAIFL